MKSIVDRKTFKKEKTMGKGKDKKKAKKEKELEAANNGKEKGGSQEPREKMSRKDYEKELKKLQVELVKLQEWVKYTGAKIVVVFEGRDTAGKGGVIKAITERTSPRVIRTVALSAPTEREKSQMYFQRYMPHLPAAGEVVLFDRSWYNRAGVERVMGFATKEQVTSFLKNAPSVEQSMVNSGIILVKYWLEVSKENQAKRFKERLDEYVKIWKLSPMDVEAQARWYDYSRARDAMFEATDTEECPWYVVDANDQRKARLNCISHLLSIIPYEDVPHKKVQLPKAQKKGKYVEPDYPYRRVPEKY
jgi:polyphosphate kinase 2